MLKATANQQIKMLAVEPSSGLTLSGGGNVAGLTGTTAAAGGVEKGGGAGLVLLDGAGAEARQGVGAVLSG